MQRCTVIKPIMICFFILSIYSDCRNRVCTLLVGIEIRTLENTLNRFPELRNFNLGVNKCVFLLFMMHDEGRVVSFSSDN